MKKNYQYLDSVQEASNYHNASTKIQRLTVTTGPQAVTLKNPHVICNSQATAATIAVMLKGETTYTLEYFAAAQERTMAVSNVGGTAQGSTASTVVTIRGIE